MKKNIIYYLFCFIGIYTSTLQASAFSDHESCDNQSPSNKWPIHKLSEDFFYGEMKSPAGKNLWLVMEQVNYENIKYWKQYINVQANDRVISRNDSMLGSDNKPILKGGSTGDGSLAFKEVLEKILLFKNEIWVAYISNSKNIPQKIRAEDIECYSLAALDHHSGSEFTKSIEMFVTITSSKDALITSHMGITVSAENILNRQRKTSLDLHSFAAKVMLMRKPERKYMVNSPAFAMANIIANALPDHVYYGTREMRKTLQNVQGIGLNEYAHTTNGDNNEGSYYFDDKNETKIESLRKRITKQANINVARSNERLKKELLGKEGDQVKHIIEKHKKFNSVKDYGEINPENEIVVSLEKIELKVSNQLKQDYYYFKNPYIFPLAERDNQGIELLKYMELHPPVISATRPNGKKEFSIFDSKNPSKVWLSIDEENLDVYNWMFSSTFGQLGKTHYMAVDLNALANCRHLIPESKI